MRPSAVTFRRPICGGGDGRTVRVLKSLGGRLAPVDDGWARVRPYMRPGERVLWCGRPDPRVLFAPADGFLIPFTVLWCSFAVFWEVMVARAGGPAFPLVFGASFIGFGVYLVFGRFLYKRRRKLQTVYALTSERAMVAVAEHTLIDSPARYQAVVIRRSRDEQHVTVTFGRGGSWLRPTFYNNSGLEFFNWHGTAEAAFYDVPNPAALLAALDHIRATPAVGAEDAAQGAGNDLMDALADDPEPGL